MANFCSNNSDGRTWTFYATYLTLDRDNPGFSLIHFVRKLLFLLNGRYFYLGFIYKLFKAHVNYALIYILRILGPIKFCKGPMEISKGPLKLCNLHVFE